jgi:hypothetical protein
MSLQNGERTAMHVGGAGLDDALRLRVHAQVESLVAQSDDPRSVADVLIETIREAAMCSQSVGAGVMLNCLPIAPGPPTGDVLLVGKMPDLEVRTFRTSPPAGLMACGSDR